MNTLETPTFYGYFWLPGNEDKRVPGRFYCNDQGTLELEIIGTFSGAPIDLNPAHEVSRILGVSEKGKLVTLEDCLYLNQRFSLPGFPVSRIHVGFALVGCHFGATETVAFDEIHFYSEAVNEWLSFAPIETTFTEPRPRGVSISLREPDPLEWELSEHLRMRIRSVWTATAGKRTRGSTIDQMTWVSFSTTNSTSLSDLLRIIDRFNNFVSFVVDQPVLPDSIEAGSSALVETVGERERRVRIQVFHATGHRGSPNQSRVAAQPPLFAFRDVRDSFGAVVSNWFDNFERFDSSFNLYFATKRGRDLYLDNRFLMLTQAVESFHRHSSRETTFSAENYAKLSRSLESAVAHEFRDWLGPRLRYGNEPSFRQRLGSLFGGFEFVYGDARRAQRLISKVVDTRNYLTHYDASLRPRSAAGRDLYGLCMCLETLFQIHLCMLCGFPGDKAVELCRGSETFRRKLAHI